MRKTILLSLFFIHYSIIYCQSVGIGTSKPASSAQLEIKSTTKGFLMPRMTTVQRNAIGSPVAGLQVFNLDNQAIDSYDGTTWTKAVGLRQTGSSADAVHATSNSWIQQADFGGIARNAAAGFSIGSKGYIGTGYTGNSVYKNDLWEYDPLTNAWSQKADFGGDARANAVGFSIGGNGYIGTGSDDAKLKKDFWEYDPVANSWTQKASFTGTPRVYAIGFSIAGNGYIGTGTDSTAAVFTNDFWQYNSQTDVWTRKADFAGGVRTSAVGFSIGDKGYIGTGTDGSIKNDFWEYDTTANTWTQKAIFPGDARVAAAGFSMDNKGYIGLGNDNSTNKNDFWQYDPVTNAWVQKADYPGIARQATVSFSIGSKGYIGTGYAGTGSIVGSKELWEYMDDNQVYSFSTNAISSTNSVSDGSWTIQNNTVHNSNLGNVGIGTATPAAKLNVSGALQVDNHQQAHQQGAFLEWNKDNSSGITYLLNQKGTGSGGIILGEVDVANNIKQNLVIEYNGNATLAGVLTQNSDERLKTNIHPLSTCLQNLQQLNGYSYNWKDKNKDNDLQVGVLAQEVQKIYPELVKTAEDGTLSVNYSGLVPVLIEGMKEQQEQIDQQNKLTKDQQKQIEKQKQLYKIQQKQIEALIQIVNTRIKK